MIDEKRPDSLVLEKVTDRIGRAYKMYKAGDLRPAYETLLQTWRLLPEPKREHPEALYILVITSDICIDGGWLNTAAKVVATARNCPGSDRAPGVHIQAGRLAHAQGDEAGAREAFIRAHVLGGFDVFRGRDPAYLAYISGHAAHAPTGVSHGIVESPFAMNPDRMEDINLTTALARIVALPVEMRPAGWRDTMLALLWNASLDIPEEAPIKGPDGYPYLRMQFPTPGQPFDATCLARVAEQLVEAGCGMAFFAHGKPGYIMPMGVIDSLLRYADPKGDPKEYAEMKQFPEKVAPTWFTAGPRNKGGTPTLADLPPYAARCLHEHMTRRWGVKDPRVMMFTSENTVPRRSLMIQTSRTDLPENEAAAMRTVNELMWYLPPSRSITLRPDIQPIETMTRLADLF